MNSEVRKFIRRLTRKGWTFEHLGSGHIRLTSPEGARVHMASSPSDVRALKNVKAEIRRVSRMSEAARPSIGA